MDRVTRLLSPRSIGLFDVFAGHSQTISDVGADGSFPLSATVYSRVPVSTEPPHPLQPSRRRFSSFPTTDPPFCFPPIRFRSERESQRKNETAPSTLRTTITLPLAWTRFPFAILGGKASAIVIGRATWPEKRAMIEAAVRRIAIEQRVRFPSANRTPQFAIRKANQVCRAISRTVSTIQLREL